MKFVAVDPSAIPELKDSRRGRISYPIVKGFLETNIICAKIDRTGMQQSLQSLSSSIRSYIRGHDLPVSVFMRSGEVYLLRLDLNPDGTTNEYWREELEALMKENGLPEMPLDNTNPNEIPNITKELVNDKVAKSSSSRQAI